MNLGASGTPAIRNGVEAKALREKVIQRAGGGTETIAVPAIANTELRRRAFIAPAVEADRIGFVHEGHAGRVIRQAVRRAFATNARR